MKKLFLIVAAVALMLVGCKKQSELNFTDMGEATVLVNVVYNPGEHDVNGVLITGEVPVTDAVVLAKIQYSEYSDPAQGAKEIEAENKGEGNYEVKVPAGQKPVNVEIIVRDYAAPYYENKDYAVNAMWTADPIAVGGLMKDYVKAVNVTMYKYENIANDAMTKELTVEGITKAEIEKLVFIDDEDPSLAESNIAGLEIKYAPMGCEFEMVLNNYYDDRTITYTFTSDAATGAFSQTVNLEEMRKAATGIMMLGILKTSMLRSNLKLSLAISHTVTSSTTKLKKSIALQHRPCTATMTILVVLAKLPLSATAF